MEYFAMHLSMEAMENLFTPDADSFALQLAQMYLQRVLNIFEAIPHHHHCFTFGRDAIRLG